MPELSPGDKVVYGTFVGTVRQLIKDTHCVIGLRAPMSDGATSVVAPVDKCEVVSVLPEALPEPVEEAPPEAPAAVEAPAETPETESVVEESEPVPESTETAEESAEEESN